jgi:hypothetical protein
MSAYRGQTAVPTRPDPRGCVGNPPSPAARVRKVGGAMLPWALLAITIVLWVVAAASAPGSFAFGEDAGRNLWDFTLEMATVLPAMFVLVGLFDVWVPRRVIERHLGSNSGPLAVLWMVLLGMLQAGPLYAAFPVAVALWRKGSAPRNVFVYLFSFSALKIPMLTFEVGFLGWQFSLVRTAVTLPVFITLAYLMERLLPAGVTLSEEPTSSAAGESRGERSKKRQGGTAAS